MRKWWIVVSSLVILLLAGALAAPWLAYWVGLSKIEGRPVRAARDVTAEEVDRLCKQLRISQPFHIDQISPYSYILQAKRGSASIRIAWLIARYHNAEHLDDHRYWHLSGAALTIWLTRNWTPSELIVKAIELRAAGP